MEIKEELFSTVWPEVELLMQEHYEEVSLYAGQEPLDVYVEMYKQLESMGIQRSFTFRADGKLVGYCSFFITPHMRHKSKLVAQNDCIYIHPDYRKGFSGVKFITTVTEILKKDAPIVTWHVKDKFDFSPVLLRQGFIKQDTLYSFLRT